MTATFSSQTIHIVFGLKNRQAWIKDVFKERLYSYIGGIANNKQCKLLAIGGTSDHLHLLLSIHPQISTSELVRFIKSNSSKFIHTEYPEYRAFAWQSGYGAFSVSYSNIQNVIKYISNQEEHHKRHDFKEEIIALLKKHRISFDENYLFK